MAVPGISLDDLLGVLSKSKDIYNCFIDENDHASQQVAMLNKDICSFLFYMAQHQELLKHGQSNYAGAADYHDYTDTLKQCVDFVLKYSKVVKTAPRTGEGTWLTVKFAFGEDQFVRDLHAKIAAYLRQINLASHHGLLDIHLDSQDESQLSSSPDVSSENYRPPSGDYKLNSTEEIKDLRKRLWLQLCEAGKSVAGDRYLTYIPNYEVIKLSTLDMISAVIQDDKDLPLRSEERARFAVHVYRKAPILFAIFNKSKLHFQLLMAMLGAGISDDKLPWTETIPQRVIESQAGDFEKGYIKSEFDTFLRDQWQFKAAMFREVGYHYDSTRT